MTDRTAANGDLPSSPESSAPEPRTKQPAEAPASANLTSGHRPAPRDPATPQPNTPQPGDNGAAPPKHDPDGLDVALDLVAGLASMPSLPPPRVGPSRRAKQAERHRQPGDLEPLGDVVGQMASNLGWQGRISLHVLQTRWAQLAGDINATHSQPVALDDGVLTVRADSSTWASALRLFAPQLLAKLNEAVGDGVITRINVTGPTAPSWKHGRRAVRDGRGPRDTYG